MAGQQRILIVTFGVHIIHTHQIGGPTEKQSLAPPTSFTDAKICKFGNFSRMTSNSQ